MKKVFLKGVFLLSILLLSSCGLRESSKDVSNQQDKVYELDFNVTNPDSSEISKAHYYAYTWLPRELEKRSEGRIKVNVYFDGQLTKRTEMLETMKNGAIDISYDVMAYYGDQIPEAFVTSFPYLAEDAEKAHELWYSTEISDVFNEAFKERGLTPLMHTFISPVGWLLNKPVQEIEEMNGLIVATYGGLLNPWYEELGIVGVDVPPKEWYNVLARRVVEGVPTAFTTLGENHFNLKEVIDYVILPAHAPVMSTLLISNQTLEDLPEDLQKIIFEVSKEAEFLALDGTKEDTKQTMKRLYQYEEAGDVEIITLPAEEVEKLYEKVQPMFDRFASRNDGSAKIVEIIREYNEK